MLHKVLISFLVVNTHMCILHYVVTHCQNGTRTALTICLCNIAFMLPTVSVQVVFINLSARQRVGHKFKRDCSLHSVGQKG